MYLLNQNNSIIIDAEFIEEHEEKPPPMNDVIDAEIVIQSICIVEKKYMQPIKFYFYKSYKENIIGRFIDVYI